VLEGLNSLYSLADLHLYHSESDWREALEEEPGALEKAERALKWLGQFIDDRERER
jgi:hypothetical protein